MKFGPPMSLCALPTRASVVVAVCLTIASVGIAEGVITFPPKKALDGKKLMSGAIPVDEFGKRRMGYEGDFSITGDHSIKFHHCLSLKIEADEDVMFAQQTYDYTEYGQLLKQQSYVLFDVCNSENCKKKSHKQNLYMTSLANYMGALSRAYAGSNTEGFCEACYLYCMGGADNVGDDAVGDDADGDDVVGDDDGGRRLNKMTYIDCGNCEAAVGECNLNDDDDDGGAADDDGDVTDDEIDAYLAQIVGCAAINQKWLGNDLYVSFMCNADGSGVEYAIFLDEDCTIYTNIKSFFSIGSGAFGELMYKAYYPIVYQFDQIIDCDVALYYPPQNSEYQYMGSNNGDEVSEYCEDLMAGATEFASCAPEEEEAQEEEEEELVQEQEGYEFYTYVLSYEDSQDDQKVCSVIASFDGNWCYGHNYLVKWSGKFFKYKNKMGKRCFGMGGGLKTLGSSLKMFFGVLLAIGLLIGTIMLGKNMANSFILKHRQRANKKKKAEPLISNDNGMFT